ncbi:SRPBCC family protein [Geobacter sp. AOG2]|uniref:SRPBCC family protein n=1 Tax=Geobacter sp. AOG2 TaxID=1566347 RepID=UPI001CC607D1|nr:SRPBCC family protein [Geobacter sp. AOG2]GFE62891.1 ATPase [Geobacter sp. AOG2]
MNSPIFLYVSYIRTTPEELWEALTSSEFTREYWMGLTVESDWKTGSSVRFIKPDGSSVLSGAILAAEKPQVLSYTWSYQGTEQARAEKPSRVTFLLERFEPDPNLVKLTVTHDEFPENTTVFKDISNGWPMVLSSLKTLLETKQAMHFTGNCGK